MTTPRWTEPSYESVRATHDGIVNKVIQGGRTSPVSALKQLEAATYLTILLGRASAAGNTNVVRALSDFADSYRQGYVSAASVNVPGVPQPTRVQQRFYENLAQESKAITTELQTVRRLNEKAKVKAVTKAKVEEVTATITKRQQP